jgi:glutamate--cysteine ligase
MFHIENDIVRSMLLKGNFGLEKESLRITRDGNFALSLHPFPDNKNIVYDFCENQTEINTPVQNNVHDAMECLDKCTKRIRETPLGMTSKP